MGGFIFKYLIYNNFIFGAGYGVAGISLLFV